MNENYLMVVLHLIPCQHVSKKIELLFHKALRCIFFHLKMIIFCIFHLWFGINNLGFCFSTCLFVLMHLTIVNFSFENTLIKY
jgi:hypothetical protein